MNELFSTILILGIVVFGLSWFFSESERRKRRLRSALRYSIADFPDGSQAKVVGRLVMLDTHLTAPLSGRSCAYYCVKVEQYRSTGKSGSWYTIITEQKGVDFALDDGTGTAIVQVESAETVLTEDHRTESGTFDDPSDIERDFLASHGRQGKGWLLNKRIRYIESVLEADKMVAVLAYGSKEPDPNAAPGGYRDSQPLRLRMSGSIRYPPLISDDHSVQ